MHCLWWNKSVSNRIPCASLLFSWTPQPQLGLDGSWVSHLYFLTDRNITSVARVMFLRSSQTRTIGKFTSVASVTFSGSQSIKRKWKGDLQKYLGDDISGSAPTTQRGQEEEHSCNRDHPNWYLWHLINDSINIISTSQMLEAPATTATTAPTSSQHHRGQINWEHRSSINDSTNQQATTTTTLTLLMKVL